MTVSILIPTNLADRPGWVEHRLNFLSALGHRGDVVVGVWGGHDRVPALKAFAAKLKIPVSIIEQRAEVFATFRLIELAESAAHPLVMAQGDDDFILPSELDAPAQLLAQDATVFCSRGRAIAVEIDSPKGTMIDWYPSWQALEAEPLERFAAFVKNFGNLWHAVYRRAQFIERMRYMSDVAVATDNGVFYEYAGDFYSAIQGKVVFFDQVGFIKAFHSENAAATLKSELSRKMPPYLILAETFSKDVAFIEKSVNGLLAARGVNTENRQQAIMNALVDFVAYATYKTRQRQEPQDKAIRQMLAEQPLNPGIAGLLNAIKATQVTATMMEGA